MSASLPKSGGGGGGGGGGGAQIIKDFSVDAQRRMFIEQQARERQLAEEARLTRKHKTKKSGSGGAKVVVGNDDDDDSINDIGNDAEECSLDSEESFYVGIERADYTQPDNLTLYKAVDDCAEGGLLSSSHKNGQKQDDRLGISHVSIAIINRQQQQQTQQGGSATTSTTNTDKVMLDWDADIPILPDEKSHGSSLYEFMNGRSAAGSSGSGNSKKDGGLVAMPLVESEGSGTTNLLTWNEDHHVLNNDMEMGDINDQVYQHKAAEGKMFIDKILSARTMSDADAAPPTIQSAVATSSSAVGGGARGEGTFPTLSPMQLYIPGIAATGRGGEGGRTAVGQGEETTNFMRQMRERELRKEENARVMARTMQEIRELIASSTAAAESTTSADEGSAEAAMKMVDANALMKNLEELMMVE